MTGVPASVASPTAAGSYDWLLEEVGALVADAAEARKPELGLTASLDYVVMIQHFYYNNTDQNE